MVNWSQVLLVNIMEMNNIRLHSAVEVVRRRQGHKVVLVVEQLSSR
jgi:hypothetical protein